MPLWKEKSMTRQVFQLDVWDEKKKSMNVILTKKKKNESKFQIKKRNRITIEVVSGKKREWIGVNCI